MSHKHVLLAEDDAAESRMICDAFAAVDPATKFTCVTTAQEVVAYLSGDGVYDLSFALIDLHLADGGGQKLLRELSDNPQMRLLPVIVFSGTTDPEEVIRCYNSGASAFVSKPDDMEGYLRVARAMSDFWLDINVTAKPEVSLF